METQQENTSAFSIISENICSQLIAFQEVIASREEGNRYPTAQEINLQCKLINCLDKLRRQMVRQQAESNVKGFLCFVSKGSKELGATLRQKYADYQASKHQITAGVAAPPEEPGQRNVSPQAQEEPVREPLHSGSTTPVSERDFREYRHLISQFSDGPDSEQFYFHGRYVNAKWLGYNLFQYTLPVHERSFTNSVEEAVSEVNQQSFQMQVIRYYCSQPNVAA